MYPLKWLTEYSLGSAIEAKTEAVICHVYENAVAEAWATPDKIKAFQSRGIPVLSLKDQKYLIPDPGVLRATVSDFLNTARGTDRR
jgi:hypothetical protein